VQLPRARGGGSSRRSLLVERAVATFGRLDMAFNNAGIQVPPTDAADEPAEHFDRVNAINLRGVWTCMKHELGQMRAQGSGAIVNCSSLGGLVGLPGRAADHASKHGVSASPAAPPLSTRPVASAPMRSARGRSRPRWSKT
jgi:NAD(P)-dependent dehydrogenase (short-subunit alcohol dehydrogenase family)